MIDCLSNFFAVVQDLMKIPYKKKPSVAFVR
jgi:hypothetical protein